MAFANNTFKIIEVCRVAPRPPSSPTSPPPPESLPLTFLDLLWLRFEPVERLYFYKTSSSSTLVPKLKTSLSAALHHFLPLAGNLIWRQDSPKPVLSYVQGDTVSLTIAESNADFSHLASTNHFVEAQEYHPLIPKLQVTPEKSAAMSFQVTIFPNKGFSIGTSMHHAILDGKSSTMFVKSWAHICKHQDQSATYPLPVQLEPFWDRSVILDRTRLEAIYSNYFLNMGSDRPDNRSLMFYEYKAPPPDSIRGTFAFTRAEIDALKQRIKSQQHHQSARHLSTFCVTCAYTWVCLVKAEEVAAEKAVMGFTVDCRSRLSPPIPENYLGNCLVCRIAVVERKRLLGEDGLIVAANAISEAVKSLESGVLDGAENWMSILDFLGDEGRILLSVAGSPRLEVYDTNFGWGTPEKVEVVSIEKTGAMSTAEGRDGGGGVEVGLVLKKREVDGFASLFAQGLATL